MMLNQAIPKRKANSWLMMKALPDNFFRIPNLGIGKGGLGLNGHLIIRML